MRTPAKVDGLLAGMTTGELRQTLDMVLWEFRNRGVRVGTQVPTHIRTTLRERMREAACDLSDDEVRSGMVAIVGEARVRGIMVPWERPVPKGWVEARKTKPRVKAWIVRGEKPERGGFSGLVAARLYGETERKDGDVVLLVGRRAKGASGPKVLRYWLGKVEVGCHSDVELLGVGFRFEDIRVLSGPTDEVDRDAVRVALREAG